MLHKAVQITAMHRVSSAFFLAAWAFTTLNCGGYLDRKCATSNEFCDGGSRLSLLFLLVQPYTKLLVSANTAASSISLYSVSRSTGALQQLSETGAITPAAIGYRSTGSILVVANQGSNTVQSYFLNLATGQLTYIASLSIVNTAFLVMDPLGRFVFVSAGGSNNITTVSINSAGAMSTGAITGTTGGSPAGLAVDPWGRFLYAGFSGSGTITTFLIGDSGTLTDMGSAAGCTGGNMNTVSNDGAYLYVSCAAFNNIMAFSINQTTGTLTSLGTNVANITPKQIAVSPRGETVLAAQTGLGIFRTSGGSLSQAGSALTGQRVGVAVDYTGQFVWSTRNSAIDTGTLSGQAFTQTNSQSASTAAGVLLPINAY